MQKQRHDLQNQLGEAIGRPFSPLRPLPKLAEPCVGFASIRFYSTSATKRPKPRNNLNEVNCLLAPKAF